MSYRPPRDPNKEIIIEDIKRTTLGDNDVLFIQLHKHTDLNLVHDLNAQIRDFFGENAGKVLVFVGDVKLHKITIENGKAVVKDGSDES